MSEGIGLIERFYKDVMESGNLALIDELATDGFVDHEEGLPGQPPGKDGVKFFVNTMRSAFPDIKVKEIAPSLSAGNMEACHVILTGTHRGRAGRHPGNRQERGVRLHRHHPCRGREGGRALGHHGQHEAHAADRRHGHGLSKPEARRRPATTAVGRHALRVEPRLNRFQITDGVAVVLPLLIKNGVQARQDGHRMFGAPGILARCWPGRPAVTVARKSRTMATRPARTSSTSAYVGAAVEKTDMS